MITETHPTDHVWTVRVNSAAEAFDPLPQDPSHLDVT
jgi:hypothetical protein